MLFETVNCGPDLPPEMIPAPGPARGAWWIPWPPWTPAGPPDRGALGCRRFPAGPRIPWEPWIPWGPCGPAGPGTPGCPGSPGTLRPGRAAAGTRRGVRRHVHAAREGGVVREEALEVDDIPEQQLGAVEHADVGAAAFAGRDDDIRGAVDVHIGRGDPDAPGERRVEREELEDQRASLRIEHPDVGPATRSRARHEDRRRLRPHLLVNAAHQHSDHCANEAPPQE